MLAISEEPFGATTCGFDKVPRVEALSYCLDAERTALVARWFCLFQVTECGLVGGRAHNVGSVGEGPPVKDCKKGHLDAEEHRRNADFDVRSLNAVARLDCTRTCEEGDDDGLPEAEEDDQLDSQDLQDGFMLSYVGSNLVVELDDAVHGYSDSYTFYDHDPHMGESWIQ